ncbi:hypothetical protein C0J52_28311, partial [Blattella germanica]
RPELVERVKSQANNVVDAVVELLKKYALEHSLEPMQIPDMHEDFTISIFGIDFDGVLDLKNGLLSHLTTLARSGEASIEYIGNIVHITTELEFSDLIVSNCCYEYQMKTFSASPMSLNQLKGMCEKLKVYL